MSCCGLDVSSRNTTICIADCEGKIFKEANVTSDPDTIARTIMDSGYICEKVGLESSSTAACCRLGLRYSSCRLLIDARHAAAMRKSGLHNKSDRNDTRGIAHLMRTNAYRQVWVKS